MDSLTGSDALYLPSREGRSAELSTAENYSKEITELLHLRYHQILLIETNQHRYQAASHRLARFTYVVGNSCT